MPEYFYTVDMGDVYGPRLEQLAAEAGADDVEAFARDLLKMAIDLQERRQGREIADAVKSADTRLPGKPGSALDDDLPF